MNHEMAIQTLAVESYLLGEMTPAEREEFEQHFFECPECAQDMRDAMELMSGARMAGAEPLQPVPSPAAVRPLQPSPKYLAWLRPRVAAGVISALAAACVIEAVFIPTLRHRLDDAVAPRVTASAFLVPQTRGAAKVVQAAPGAPLVLMLDLPDSASGKLQFVLRHQDGRVESRMLADAPPAGQSVTISIPRMDLAPGEYLLVVEASAPAGQDGQALRQYPFELQRP